MINMTNSAKLSTAAGQWHPVTKLKFTNQKRSHWVLPLNEWHLALEIQCTPQNDALKFCCFNITTNQRVKSTSRMV